MVSKYHVQDTSPTMKLSLLCLALAIASSLVTGVNSAPPVQNEVVEPLTQTINLLGGSLNTEVGSSANFPTEVPPEVSPEATNVPVSAMELSKETTNTSHAILNITGIAMNNTGTLKTPIEDDVNGTIKGFRSTEYLFFNPHQFAYKIFMKKVIEALRIFNLLIKMDPFIMKLTKTYLVTNNTDFDDDHIHETLSGVIKPQEQFIETNTESTLNVSEILPGIEEEKHENLIHKINNDIPQIQNETEDLLPHSEATISPSTEYNKQNIDEEDIKKTKVVPEGFFSKIGSAVSGFFHLLTSWF